MTVSADVSAGDTVLATQYNNLRADAVANFVKHRVGPTGGTKFWLPGWAWGVRTNLPNQSLTADELYYIPIHVARSSAFTKLGIHVQVAGAGSTVARLGIYSSKFNAEGALEPDALTDDAGTVAVDSTGEKLATISETLAAGYHFLAISSDGVPQLSCPPGGSSGGNPCYVSHPFMGYNNSVNVSNMNVIPGVTVADGAAALPDPATTPDAIYAHTYATVRLRD